LLNVESSQVETGEGLTKLACLATQVAVHRSLGIAILDGINDFHSAKFIYGDQVLSVWGEIHSASPPTLSLQRSEQWPSILSSATL
jgi:hypothetical protein